jgi:hypothetical protein
MSIVETFTRFFGRSPSVACSWDAWREENSILEPEPVGPPSPDFEKLQEQLDLAMRADGGHWTPDGKVVFRLEMDASLVADMDRLVALHGLESRARVLQRGVELLKLLSSKSTYDTRTPRKIREI